MPAGLFDLVAHKGSDYTVCGVSDGRLRLIGRTWPVEFAEVEDFVAPAAFEVGAGEVTVKETGQERLLGIARMLLEAEERAGSKGSLDWNDVDAALEASAQVVPSNLLEIDYSGRGAWRLADVPDEMLLLANPAAMVIATHAVRLGEADIADIETATAWARDAVAKYDAPSGPSV